jgi:hypothetical protein
VSWGRRKPEEAEVAESSEALDKVRRLAREAAALGAQVQRELEAQIRKGHERGQSAG